MARRKGEGTWDKIKRGSRTYERFRIQIDGRVHQRVSASKAKIEKDALALIQRARQRLVGADEDLTLALWVDRWLADKEVELGPAGAKTLSIYRGTLKNHVLPSLGKKRVRDLRGQHRRDLRAALVRTGLKASTVNSVDSVLRSCLAAAVAADLPVAASAVATIAAVRGDPEEKPTLTADQVRAILATSRATPWYALWVCYAATGARDAEVRALRWEDWDQEAGTLAIRRQLPQRPGDPPQWQNYLKGRKRGRVVPVVPLLAAALREHRARQNEARLFRGEYWSNYDLVFPDEMGRALASQRINDMFTAACEDAGITPWRGLGVHRLRAAANQLLREAGVDAPLRSQILGHTVEVNERSYVADSADLAASAMAHLGERLAR